MTRRSLYPRNLHAIKTISNGIESLIINDEKYHLYIKDDMIAAYYNETENSFFSMPIFGIEPINELMEYCNTGIKYNNILEI